MPELAEIKIMSDFINQNCKDKTFTKLEHVEKGNNPKPSHHIRKFKIHSETNGKELLLSIKNEKLTETYSVFMGMSGNWKFVKTKDWLQTKYVRMKLDTTDGFSLLLYGAYMGPKYRLGGFTGVKRGPDPTKDFEKFQQNIFDNLHKKDFLRPICEVLLNQKYFNGIGNYLRSSILYYSDVNPFEIGSKIIANNKDFLKYCKDIPLQAYRLNGGQLQDWNNPFGKDSKEFDDWVFYQKGLSVKDSTGRTLWYDEKWKEYNLYQQ